MGRIQTEKTKQRISQSVRDWYARSGRLRVTKYCSCGQELSWNNSSGKCKKCKPTHITHSESVTKCRQKRKRDLIEYKGGKCIQCGYDKCVGALEFHHRNPDEKEYRLGIGSGTPHSWERDIKEVDKCDLLCANCHREEHWRLTR